MGDAKAHDGGASMGIHHAAPETSHPLCRYTRIKKPKWTPPNWLFGGVS